MNKAHLSGTRKSHLESRRPHSEGPRRTQQWQQSQNGVRRRVLMVRNQETARMRTESAHGRATLAKAAYPSHPPRIQRLAWSAVGRTGQRASASAVSVSPASRGLEACDNERASLMVGNAESRVR